jgi:hypothetical protein
MFVTNIIKDAVNCSINTQQKVINIFQNNFCKITKFYSSKGSNKVFVGIPFFTDIGTRATYTLRFM